MTEQERLNELEEIMELDEGTLKMEDTLDSYVEWDSVTILSLISWMDETHGKTVSGEDFKNLVTVADVIAMMEN